MQIKPEQPTEETVPDCDISDLDLEQTCDTSETDSESDVEHALSRCLSYCSRQSDESDSSEDAWDSDDHSNLASSYSKESDASDVSEESNSSSGIIGAEEASHTSDSDEHDDGVLLWDMQPQCTWQCAVHAPEMRAMI
ncbi:uncharacterized protein ALTATR162_LOCUS3615 [Alternaria atra]|uniref:Uncharacterized protein n=1 Tax=Alternaria atra TaxID=119953 RepID=A0A8J2N4D7_9PLEO|nr:uncharacterized protein ALTATR162_LOCUS3615 [Alternaria atra]CAG5155344.1 unnamed protein product [Alternaria atra]